MKFSACVSLSLVNKFDMSPAAKKLGLRAAVFRVTPDMVRRANEALISGRVSTGQGVGLNRAHVLGSPRFSERQINKAFADAVRGVQEEVETAG